MSPQPNEIEVDYDKADTATLLRLTRVLMSLRYDVLVDLHKVENAKAGSKAPSTIWLRAIMFARMTYPKGRDAG